MHYFEGAVRILVGATAGFIFALSIKADLILGVINRSENTLIIFLVVSFVAGASERLLPSLIRQLEGTLVTNISAVGEMPSGGGGDLTQAPEPGRPGSSLPPTSTDGKKRRRTSLLRRNQERPS